MKPDSSLLHTGHGFCCLRVRKGRAAQSLGAFEENFLSRHTLQNRCPHGVHTGTDNTNLHMLQWHLARLRKICTQTAACAGDVPVINYCPRTWQWECVSQGITLQLHQILSEVAVWRIIPQLHQFFEELRALLAQACT
jgi:hypothetical protein